MCEPETVFSGEVHEKNEAIALNTHLLELTLFNYKDFKQSLSRLLSPQ